MYIIDNGKKANFFFKVAVIYYSSSKRSRTLFHLRKHSRADEAILDLEQAPSNGGTTRTGEAIYYAINEFNEKYGARRDARKMMIIFTDGYSQVHLTSTTNCILSTFVIIIRIKKTNIIF